MPFRIPLLNVVCFARSTKHRTHTAAAEGIWKSETQTSFWEPCFLIFWDWHYFAYPERADKQQSGKAFQEQKFQTHHIKIVGSCVPQLAGGRGCARPFFCRGMGCKMFVQVLQLESEQSGEHLNAFSSVQRQNERGFSHLFLQALSGWSKEDHAVRSCSTAGLRSV